MSGAVAKRHEVRPAIRKGTECREAAVQSPDLANGARTGPPLRVAVVAPIMLRHDAISLAVRDTIRALAVDPNVTVQYFGCACEFEDIEHRTCIDASELLLDPEYQAADAAIFHFGIHHSLFDALLGGGARTRIVCFHNVTPPRFVRSTDVPVMERSLRQIEVLRHADEIWAVSPTNARDLLDRGFDPARVKFIPLAVDDPAVATLAQKAAAPINVLYIGRIVPSKGLHDLIPAVAQANVAQSGARVTIAGNTMWSDPSYVAHLRALITDYGLAEVVHFAGRIDDAERDRLFHEAHILAMPSYHEGFCRPIVEGLRAGCIPLAYDAYNLPHIVAGLGRVVPTGDVGALAAAMRDVVQSLPASLRHPTEALLPLDRGLTSVADFANLARHHTDAFAFETVAAQMRQRLLLCLEAAGGAAIAISSAKGDG